jgi:hypothetical protein
LVDLNGEKRKGKAVGRGGICGGAGPARQRRGRRKEGDGGETDRWGRLFSETKRKENGAGGVGCCRGEIGGLLGRRAERVKR